VQLLSREDTLLNVGSPFTGLFLCLIHADLSVRSWASSTLNQVPQVDKNYLPKVIEVFNEFYKPLLDSRSSTGKANSVSLITPHKRPFWLGIYRL
jgi:hypothetical protein